jgi:hypothetical protein
MIVALLLLVSSAQAAPLFDFGQKLSVSKELKNTGVAPKLLEDSYSEMKMDFQSFDVNDKSGKPLLSNQTEQRMKMKKVPDDPAAPKTGPGSKLELTFEKLVTTSTVTVAGMPKPFVTKNDLGAFLTSRPLTVTTDDKGARKVEGLAEIRAKASQEVKDPIARSTLLGLLNEDILLKAGAAVSSDSSCLGAFAGKKPGEKWAFAREEQGVKLEYECEFEGWANVKGKKAALIKITSKKNRVKRQQPNGVPGMAETEGQGTLYVEPGSGESLLRMETSIFVEPTEEEIRRMQARGETVPRNRSKLVHSSRIYPL